MPYLAIIKGVKRFFIRQSLSPFETMFAFFCIYAGLARLFDFGVTVGPFQRALGSKAAIVLNVILVVSGLGIYVGRGIGRGDVEASGLILLATSLIITTIVNGWLFGLNPMVINSYVLNGAFVFSCVIRLVKIFKAPRGEIAVIERSAYE